MASLSQLILGQIAGSPLPSVEVAVPPVLLSPPTFANASVLNAPTLVDFLTVDLTIPAHTNVSVLNAPTLQAFGDANIFLPEHVNESVLNAPTLTSTNLYVPEHVNASVLNAPALNPATLFTPEFINASVLNPPALEPASFWQVVFEPGSVSSTASTAANTHRNRIPASLIMAGTKVRITYRGNTNIARAFIGVKAASGDAYDFAATPTQIFFGGNPGINIGTGLDELSDEIDFVQDGTQDLILSIEKSGGTNLRNLALTGASRWLLSDGTGTDGATVDTTGYTETINSVRVSVKFEVYGPSP